MEFPMCDPVSATVATIGAAVLAPKLMKTLTPKAPSAPAPVETPTAEAPPAPATASPAAVQPQAMGQNTTVIQQPAVEQSRPVAESRDRERRLRMRRMAANSTLITGGSGVSAPAETGTKTLLGA